MPSTERKKAGGLRWAMLSLWLVMLLSGFGFVALTAAFQSANCYRADSNRGTLTWSLVPPGHVCTWTTARNGLDARQGPGAWPSVYVALMAVSGVALVRWRPPKTERLRVSIFEPEAEGA